MEKSAVWGLGLIGGSLALALHQAGIVRTISGYDGDANVNGRAKGRDAFTYACGTVEEAVQEADMVVLATPIHAIPELLERIAPVVKPGVLVTDTASTKAQVLTWAQTILPTHAVFVGGHPMAGREESGLVAAEAGLFAGCTHCHTTTMHTRPDAVAQPSEI